MIIYVFLVAVLSMATLVLVVRGVQGIKRFGWNSRQGLWWWNAILAALFGAFVTSLLVQGKPLQLAVTAVAVGLAGGGTLLGVSRPRWPTNATHSIRSSTPRSNDPKS